jgi:hypothetical protein
MMCLGSSSVGEKSVAAQARTRADRVVGARRPGDMDGVDSYFRVRAN